MSGDWDVGGRRGPDAARFFSSMPPGRVGMDACTSTHCHARDIGELSHEVRLMPPAYVKPDVQPGKSEASDAEAICKAVTRPTMRIEW